MGVTIHYRGKMADVGQIDTFCKEMTDIASTMNWSMDSLDEDWSKPANAKLTVDNEGAKITGHLPLKGVSISPHPKCESLKLFFDPEGNLRDLMSMISILDGDVKPEDAWVFVKTQFSSPETHVWIVGLLKYLKKRYIPDLEVQDEGEYWETGSLENLKGKMDFLNEKMDMIASRLESCDVGDISKYSAEEIASLIEKIIRGEVK